MKTISLILISVGFLALPAWAQSAPTWPLGEWERRSLEDSGFSRPHFQSFLNRAFASELTFKTDSIVIVKNGYLVYDYHANDYKPDQKHALFSLGKTMLNALAGVLEQQGILNRNDKVRRYYPGIDRGSQKEITISHLMWMSSGLEWIEEDKKNLLQSDPWFAFYSRASYADMPLWVTQRAQIHPENTKFNYSSGDSGLLVATIRGAIPREHYLHFAWAWLFDKLGMRTVAIEQDQAGNLGLHGIGYASPQDIARMGLLYLRNGKVNHEQILPPDWVQFSNQMAPAQLNLPDPDDRNLQNNQSYGAQIWLNKKRAGDTELPYPELPENAMLGLGTRGQILLILPDEDLVFVRTATDTELFVKNRKNYRHRLFKLLLSSLHRGTP
jgi:CubicO group peptidase (beta-lactamase class C family)